MKTHSQISAITASQAFLFDEYPYPSENDNVTLAEGFTVRKIGEGSLEGCFEKIVEGLEVTVAELEEKLYGVES